MKKTGDSSYCSKEKVYENDMRQLNLLLSQYNLEKLNVLTNIIYIYSIRVAINKIIRKYSGEVTNQYDSESIALITAVSSVIARLFSVRFALESFSIAESRRRNGENSYSLDANIKLVNATVIGLITALLIYGVSKTFYDRTVTGIPFNI